MPEIDLPDGHYFSMSGLITAGTGGQTRALLMRNRLLAQRSGIAPILLTFDRKPHYPQVRQSLRERGELVDPMQLVNIFEWYRDTDIDHMPPTGDPLPDVQGLDAVDSPHPDGSTYSTHYLHRRAHNEVIVDYRRRDGSVYLRTPGDAVAKTARPTDVFLVNSLGQPVGRWPTYRGWRQGWIIGLAPEAQRAFIISDSRSAVHNILPLPDERFHVLHLMHNIHVGGARRWNSVISPTYVPLLNGIADLDALVTLTDRQRQDVAARFGATNNLSVVPNPVEPRPRPDPLPAREEKRFTILTRLEPQKQLEHAIQAFALVLKEEPDAKLDIYGDGAERLMLENEIAKLGVGSSVTMKGHDPGAREALWTATGFIMSSRFEGYPLATLESMSHGCPVISYDIKYGPREQITHGVDGYLVEPGDAEGMADRVVEMIRNPALVARLSEAAFEKAEAHGHVAFLKDWRHALNEVIRKKERRTRLRSVKLTVTQLGYTHGLPAPVDRATSRLPERLSKLRLAAQLAGQSSSSSAFRVAPTMRFAGKLNVVGTSKASTLDDATITLDAICEATGSTVSIPVRARRNGDLFDVSASFDPAQCFSSIEDTAYALRFRLRLVWNNSSWQTFLARPKSWTANYEASFDASGELTMLRGPGAPR